MSTVLPRPQAPARTCAPDPAALRPEPDQADLALFLSVVSTHLSPEQRERVAAPARVLPGQRHVLGVHWHPEFVPMDLIERRIRATFPDMDEHLLIPTQHNRLMEFGPYSGAEVDCYASGFNQKVQLLIHFETARLGRASALRAMLDHTFEYRSTQLRELLRALADQSGPILARAVRDCGADEDVVALAGSVARKLAALLDAQGDLIPRESVKNKVVRDFLDGLRPRLGDVCVNRVQALAKAVKEGVKAAFSLKFFYRATEIIEEVRGLGGGVVIPHPEQFWPVLLAGYDVDGVEVWNPESRRYTDFLIRIMDEKNRSRGPSARPLLVFMGDDTHMGEKTRDPSVQSAAKAAREIGVQPGWDSPEIRESLARSGVSRETVIADYKARLAG